MITGRCEEAASLRHQWVEIPSRRSDYAAAGSQSVCFWRGSNHDENRSQVAPVTSLTTNPSEESRFFPTSLQVVKQYLCVHWLDSQCTFPIFFIPTEETLSVLYTILYILYTMINWPC